MKRKDKNTFEKPRAYFIIHMMLFVFLVMTISAGIVTAVVSVLLHFKVVDVNMANPIWMVVVMLVSSVIIGTLAAAMFPKHTLDQINNLIGALKEVSKGNFDVRLKSGKGAKLNEIVDNFNQMVEELGSIETLRSDFVNNFSHEFKTPIVSIRGFAKLLKKTNLSAEDREEYLNIIVDESNRLSTLASNTLLLSKLDSQELIGSKQKYSLDEQIRQCILILEREWSEKKINLNINLPETAFYGNEDLLQQLWLNLIGNAIKFTGDGGEVIIAGRLTEFSIVVSVTDSGCGMDETTVKHIFDRFYQGDTSHATAGNGLGLAIVNRIVTILGGKIKVASKIGMGSTFTVILPIEQPPEPVAP